MRESGRRRFRRGFCFGMAIPRALRVLPISGQQSRPEDDVMDKVDLALVLAVDGSASVTYDEFNLIAGGMAAALRDADVVAAA